MKKQNSNISGRKEKLTDKDKKKADGKETRSAKSKKIEQPKGEGKSEREKLADRTEGFGGGLDDQI